jgi:hypothetical protein
MNNFKKEIIEMFYYYDNNKLYNEYEFFLNNLYTNRIIYNYSISASDGIVNKIVINRRKIIITKQHYRRKKLKNIIK